MLHSPSSSAGNIVAAGRDEQIPRGDARGSSSWSQEGSRHEPEVGRLARGGGGGGLVGDGDGGDGLELKQTYPGATSVALVVGDAVGVDAEEAGRWGRGGRFSEKHGEQAANLLEVRNQSGYDNRDVCE